MLVLTENFITLSSLRGRRKKVRGREKSAKVVKRVPYRLTLSPQFPSFPPSSLSPTPFNACYAGYTLSLEPQIIHVEPTHF